MSVVQPYHISTTGLLHEELKTISDINALREVMMYTYLNIEKEFTSLLTANRILFFINRFV